MRPDTSKGKSGVLAMLLEHFTNRYATANLGLSHQGAEQLRVAVRRFEAWVGGHVACSMLSVELVAGWLRSMLADGMAPATVNSKRRSLLTLWRSAADEGLAPPVGRIKPAREPQRTPDSWTIQEVGSLFSHARSLSGVICGIPRGLYWYSLLATLYDTGERVSAVRACRCEDFDTEKGILRIRAENQKCRRERLCSVSPETVDAISRALVTPRVDSSPIWPWPFSGRHFYRTLRRIIEDAGLPASKRGMGLTHRLRRTSGSLVEAAGGDGAKHLGNSRAVFEKHYYDPRRGSRGQLQYLPRPCIRNCDMRCEDCMYHSELIINAGPGEMTCMCLCVKSPNYQKFTFDSDGCNEGNTGSAVDCPAR